MKTAAISAVTPVSACSIAINCENRAHTEADTCIYYSYNSCSIDNNNANDVVTKVMTMMMMSMMMRGLVIWRHTCKDT